jgi:hypothetical protein
MNGKIPVADLVEHGLSNHPPNVVGVAFPTIDAVLCRPHVDSPALHRLGIGDEQTPAAAVLLVGGADSQLALRVWCTGCKASGAGTANARERSDT